MGVDEHVNCFTICTGFILPTAKTMAFGGVATGNMKAYEQVTVAGSISNNGFTFMEVAISARMGSRTLAVAVLEATSVIVAVIMQTISIIAKGGRTLSPDSCAPIKVDRPEVFDASDRAKPPPETTCQAMKRYMSCDCILAKFQMSTYK